MKKVLIFLMSFLMLFWAAACSTDPETDPQGRTILKFFGWGSVEEQEIFKTLVKEFETEYPDYTVSYEGVAATNFITTLQLKKNQRQLPDVFYMPDINFVQWMDAGIMENLTPYIEASDVFDKENIWDEAIKAYSYDAAAKKFGTGSIYALPKDLGPNVMVINLDIFNQRKAALSETDPNNILNKVDLTKPLLWSEYVEMLHALQYTKSDKGTTQTVYGVTHYPLEIAVLSNGGDFLSTDKKNITIDTPEFAESLQFVADLCNVEGVMPSPEGQTSQNGFQRFTAGLAATSFIGAWDTPALWKASFDWDIVPIPVPNDHANPAVAKASAKSVSFLGSVGFAVSNTSKNKQGAYLLAEYLSVHPTGQRINYQKGQAVPNLVDMAKGDFLDGTGLEDTLFPDNPRPHNRQVYIDIMENSPRRPQAYTYERAWWDNMWENSTNSLQMIRVWDKDLPNHVDVWNAAAKSVTAATFLKDLQTDIQTTLNKTTSKYSW